MFVAHLPAGYLLTRRIEARTGVSGVLPVGLFASVLPDVDLLRFYALDHRRVLHHAYWTHVPLWWVTIAAVALALPAALRWRRALVLGGVLVANVFLHLVLDTVAGGVAWAAPFSDHAFVLVTVPAGHRWWVWNFVLHWTFALELAITAWGIAEAVRRRAYARPIRATRSAGATAEAARVSACSSTTSRTPTHRR